MLSDIISSWFADTSWRLAGRVEKTCQAPQYRQLKVLLKAMGKNNTQIREFSLHV